MIRLIALPSIALALCFNPSPAPAAEASPTPQSADTTAARQRHQFSELSAEWRKLLTEIGQLQIKLSTAPDAEVEASRAHYRELVAQAGRLAAQLQMLAEQLYLADSSDVEVGNLLLAAAVNELRLDNYDETLRLAKLLIDRGYPDGHVFNVAASAALANMQLDEAAEFLKAIDAPNDSKIKASLDEIAACRPRWDREQKLRAAEAKADDLPRVKLQTSKGDIVVELFENEAPNTVANFVSLVEKGTYDGTRFHRVLPAFMAQGGDPLTKDWDKNAAQAGTGDAGYVIDCECYRPDARQHFRGSLSMANSGPNTGGSQFFITFAPTSHLDGKHTAFGRVIEGLDVLSKLQRIDPEAKDPSVVPDTILKAEVVRKRDHPYVPATKPRPAPMGM